MRLFLAWLALLAAVVAAPAAAAPHYPLRPAGPVYDGADILPPKQQAELDRRLRQFWADTGNALIVVSVKSLGGQTIEDYGTHLFNKWGIGDARTNRGLLLLIAPKERRVRIEVGCGLESTISDEAAAAIIANEIVPKFKTGDFTAGTLAGANALMRQAASPRPANDPGPHTAGCKAQARHAA